MAEAHMTPNKRRDRNDDTDETTTASEVAGARKRRAFLQTMGQQLREFGVDGTSPQDHGRTTFGTSPSNQRPVSRSTNVVANNASSHAIDTPESDAAPGEDDRLPAGAAKSASKWLWRANEVHLPSATGPATTPLFDDLLDWSQSYFDHWHPGFPFLHAPSLIEYMRLIAQTGLHLPAQDAKNALQHVVLRSVMSISIADRRQMNVGCKPIPATLAFQSFNDAINSVQLVLTEESSILSLQALVAVQLFLITMHRYNAASRLAGLAARMAFQLGLHRCPRRTASAPAMEAELRKRLFWSIYCIDRYISIRLGTPLGIRTDEMDVCFPHEEHHDKPDDDATGMQHCSSVLWDSVLIGPVQTATIVSVFSNSWLATLASEAQSWRHAINLRYDVNTTKLMKSWKWMQSTLDGGIRSTSTFPLMKEHRPS
jgi:hypothetical protein